MAFKNIILFSLLILCACEKPIQAIYDSRNPGQIEGKAIQNTTPHIASSTVVETLNLTLLEKLIAELAVDNSKLNVKAKQITFLKATELAPDEEVDKPLFFSKVYERDESFIATDETNNLYYGKIKIKFTQEVIHLLDTKERIQTIFISSFERSRYDDQTVVFELKNEVGDLLFTLKGTKDPTAHQE